MSDTVSYSIETQSNSLTLTLGSSDDKGAIDLSPDDARQLARDILSALDDIAPTFPISPLDGIRDLAEHRAQERLDYEWLNALMVEERLWPDRLVTAQQRWDEAQLALEKLCDQLGIDGREQVDVLNSATDAYFDLLNTFWLRVGISLGARHQWLVSQLDGVTAEIARDHLEREFMPHEYFDAIASVRETMTQDEQ